MATLAVLRGGATLHTRAKIRGTQLASLPVRSLSSLLSSSSSSSHSASSSFTALSAFSSSLSLRSPFSQPHSFFSILPSRAVLESLAESEYLANIRPDDPQAQANYLKKLLPVDPYALVHRVESGKYAHNAAVMHEYGRAKSLIEQQRHVQPSLPYNHTHTQAYPIHSTYPPGYTLSAPHPSPSSAMNFLSSSSPTASPPSSSPSSSSSSSSSSPLPGSSQSSPIHVVMAGDHRRSWFSSFLNLTLGVSGLLFLWILYNTGSQSGGIMGKGNIKEWKNDGDVPKVGFNDVKGCDEAKAELEEIVAYLRNPAHFEKLGGKMVKGILLTGSPGTGKTLLAKAIAGEAHVPFFSCSGSDFEEMYVGVGARRIRELFNSARKKAPCIIFIDEIDAVGSKRRDRDLQAARLSLNQLLVEMDGFEKSNGVIVIGATNAPKLLDPALTRPGRFDRHVTMPLPDIKGRKQILDLYAAKIPLAADVSTEILARGTSGCTGAQLYNLMNTAALRASSKGMTHVTMKELEYAKDKILMGAERANIMTLAEKTMTAYHEGGHALVGLHTPHSIPLYKATILPRGTALGVTHFLPEDDMHTRSKAQLLAQLDVCMGGRVAEEIIFGKENVGTGASNDLATATRVARQMVSQYGMSDDVGLMTVDEDDSISSHKRESIDTEINKLLDNAYQRAKHILTTNTGQLHKLADALLKHETLDVNEIKKVVNEAPEVSVSEAALAAVVKQREKEM